MYSTSPATVSLIEHKYGGVIMRAAKDLKALVADLLLNSGDEFAYWAEGEAIKAAEVWRENARLEAASKSRQNTHPDKWARCSSCGWVGQNRDLTQDGSAGCGASDDCPYCGVHGCMTCCYDTEGEAERGEHATAGNNSDGKAEQVKR